MDPEVFRLLETADWKDIGMKLVAYAISRSRSFVWRTGDPAALAKGWDPEDVAREAIRRVFEGKWEPKRGPLEPFLRMVVNSLMMNLAASKDNEVQTRVALNEDGTEKWDAVEYDARRQDHTEILSAAPGSSSIDRADPRGAEEKVKQLFTAVAGERELEEVLEAILDGCEKPREIAGRLNTSRSDIYNRLKRLRRYELGEEAEGGSDSETTMQNKVQNDL